MAILAAVCTKFTTHTDLLETLIVALCALLSYEFAESLVRDFCNQLTQLLIL
jgi:hypothetical protein